MTVKEVTLLLHEYPVKGLILNATQDNVPTGDREDVSPVAVIVGVGILAEPQL